MPIQNRRLQFRTARLLACCTYATCLTLLLFLAAPVVAQDITPQPATPDDEIRLDMVLTPMSCFNEVTEQTVSVDGNTVAVEFVVEKDESAICPTVMPPLRLNADLGTFAPGDYQLEVTGLVLDEPFGPEMTSFGVGQGDSAFLPIPTMSPTGLLLMLIAFAMIGIVALRRIRA
ncbi:MAG: hypothetical protein WD397_04140 [Wenzhouxiangellaceae bacterium]